MIYRTEMRLVEKLSEDFVEGQGFLGGGGDRECFPLINQSFRD